MKLLATRIAVFLAAQLAAVYVMWMGGFDFDTRNEATGYVAFVALVGGVGAALAVYKDSGG